MTVVEAPSPALESRLEAIWAHRPGVLGWLTTTDHKRIGLLYLFATLGFFLAGGVEAIAAAAGVPCRALVTIDEIYPDRPDRD